MSWEGELEGEEIEAGAPESLDARAACPPSFGSIQLSHHRPRVPPTYPAAPLKRPCRRKSKTPLPFILPFT